MLECPFCRAEVFTSEKKCKKCGEDLSAPPRGAATFDKKEQYDHALRQMLPGEVLHAVWDCRGRSTGFVGFTNLRLVLHDQEVAKPRAALVSIPFRNILGVAVADEVGPESHAIRTDELLILTAVGTFNLEFWGPDKFHWATEFILANILDQALPRLPDKNQTGSRS